MKIFITEKQLSSLVETTEIDSELGKENFKRYKFFLSLLNDEVKKEYPFIDEIKYCLLETKVDNENIALIV